MNGFVRVRSHVILMMISGLKISHLIESRKTGSLLEIFQGLRDLTFGSSSENRIGFQFPLVRRWSFATKVTNTKLASAPTWNSHTAIGLIAINPRRHRLVNQHVLHKGLCRLFRTSVPDRGVKQGTKSPTLQGLFWGVEKLGCRSAQLPRSPMHILITSRRLQPVCP